MSTVLTCREIADKHGLDKTKVGWRGDCPACTYAEALSMREDRDGSPRFSCWNCHDEGAIALAVGQEPRVKNPKEDEDKTAKQARMREKALGLWRGSEPAWQTPVTGYFLSRHLDAASSRSADLRFRFDCYHPEGGKHPAMVALVRDAGGEPVAVHRTYLRRDGSGKADVRPAKASLGPVWGGVIRLAPLAAELVIGEGVETALAAGMLTGLPAWAALSAGNLSKGLELPEGVRAVVISVDRDPAGERAAQMAAQRWRAEGRHVRLLVPDHPGQDAADVLAARVAAHA